MRLWAAFIWLRNRSSTEHMSVHQWTYPISLPYELKCSNIYITNPKPKSNKIDNVRITQIRRVRVTTVAVEKQLVWNLMSVCPYSCLSKWHASRFFSAPYYTVIYGQSDSNSLSHTISHHFREKATEHKMCFDFTYNRCVKNFSY